MGKIVFDEVTFTYYRVGPGGYIWYKSMGPTAKWKPTNSRGMPSIGRQEDPIDAKLSIVDAEMMLRQQELIDGKPMTNYEWGYYKPSEAKS